MLGPDDKDVEVTAESVHDSKDTSDPIAELEALTSAVGAVVVVQATAIPGQLDETQMRIKSVLHGTVIEAIKNQTKVPILVGADLPLEILVSGRRVGYRLNWAVLPKVGGTYLVFLFEEQGHLYPRGLDETFELVDGKIRRMHQDGEWGLSGTLDATTSLTIVRDVARQLVVK